MIRGGNSYVSSAPAFSNDGKSLLVCTTNTVSVFSTATGLQVSSLTGHMALVTTVLVVPASSPKLCYCWTASLDGTIRYWDFAVPELIKTVDIRLPIFSMVIPSLLGQPAEGSERQPDIFAYVSTEEIKESELCGRIRKCNLTKSRLVGGLILKETPQPEFITISPAGNFFSIRHNHTFHIWKVPAVENNNVKVERMTLHHTKVLTVLAFHPTESIVAAGDESGRLLIWRGFGSRIFATTDKLRNGRLVDNEERPGVRGDDDADSCSTWHWHSDEVNVLSFSSDGAHLYSGGKEGVLVVWQIDTGKKKFLPRIGSPLIYFSHSPDPLLASISCADNQIHLLKMPSMEILKSISGIKLPCSLPKIYEGPHNEYAFDCNAGLVALRTENYCVHFYSLLDDRGVSEVQVCARNHQPGDDVTVVVTHVALSKDGSIMSTAEVKLPEDGLGGLVCLKFWSLGSQDKKFSLSTIVYEPHRDAYISAVAFHPARPMAVSASHGGDFKIWVGKNEIQQKNQILPNSGWTCHAVGSYKKKKMTAATFSSDGSVLAVAAETVITLWDPDKNVLVAVVGSSFMPITNLSFVGDYLVSACQDWKPQLSVWSMSKLSECWSYKLHVEAMACAEDSSSFAVLALLPKLPKHMESDDESASLGRDGVIMLFNIIDPVPVATWSVCKAKGGGLAFIKDNDNMSDGKPSQVLLVYVNSDHEYILFDPYSQEVDEVNAPRHEGTATLEETGKFGYASIYGELAQFDPKRKQITDIPSVPSEKPWETIFSGSSHNLPPLTKLCSTFLESLLEKRMIVAE